MFEKDILESLDLRNEESYFLLNFIFYKPSNQATKIQRLIKDISPSIFRRIGEAAIKANKRMREGLNQEFFKSYVGLQNLYYMIPVKVKQGDVTKYRDLLDLYDALFTGRPIKKQHLIDKFIEAINVKRLDKEGYNLKSDQDKIDWTLSIAFYLLNANMLIKFFEFTGCLKEGNPLNISALKVSDGIKTFIEKMNYNEQQSAMFILGYLIGEIGNAQYRRLDGNKPILNKLNFNGIDKTKIVRLTNDVFAKLKQEKIRAFNEVTYFELKRLIDSNIASWKLNKNENLFYLLSGYSFATTQPILKEENKHE
ncbi:hypothetical protein U473_02925 [Tepidibacillus decaturensis]|uniref:Uncharacterized protein n=1 Tax=Tepidibacillus decaturensis TaxID=1413211 RepID=A0A135L251_9BACI|nr:hypothetical protein U473_02925 [Tepidibacillus decaturensis]